MRKTLLHRSVNIILGIAVIVSSFGSPLTTQASPTSPETYKRSYGWINDKYAVEGSEVSTVSGDTMNEQMFLTKADVKFTGALTGEGYVNNYSKSTSNANNGYPIVDYDEARAWARNFNGSPSFMTNANGLYGMKISRGGPNAEDYTGYLLATVAEMSGGGGRPFQFRSAKSTEPGTYVGVTNFVTTPRPDGSISTNKSQYEIGETVNVTAKGKDYSIYNRGLNVLDMYIYNVDTGLTEYQFSQAIKKYEISGAANPDGSGTGYEVAFPIQNWIPTKAGNYEARILFTDTHARNTQNSPSVEGTGTPYKALFKVGNVTDPDPDPEPGPGCSVSSTSTKMDIQVNGDKDVKDYKAVSSGGSSISVEKFAEISVYSTKAGKFTMNGNDMETGSGGNRKIGIGSVGGSGTVKVIFLSDDGKECWEKTFIVESGNSGNDQCPIITIVGQTVRNGETLEILPSETLRFKATYKDKYGDAGPASIKWDVVRPDGKVETLPGSYDEVGGRERWVTNNASSFELPFGNGSDSHDVIFEKGKTYKLRLNYDSAQWKDMPECAWEITIKVKDASCSITEQNRIKFTAYGSPGNPYPPGGTVLTSSGISEPIYYSLFEDLGDTIDTKMGLSASAAGRWYVKANGKKTPLTGKLTVDEKFDLILPTEIVDVGEIIVLIFESDTGCVRELSFEILSDRKCYDLLVSLEAYSGGDVKWKETIKRGDTVEVPANDLKNNRLRLFTSTRTKYLLYWLDPETQTWQRKRNGESLANESDAKNSHNLWFPKDESAGIYLDGFYKVLFYDEESDTGSCDGHFFVQVGKGSPTPDGENLLIVKSSFVITPDSPRAAATDATITFNVKNAGKLEHNTKLAVRWESSPTATILDVNNFKPGETRKITIPTKYPQQSEDFIGNINPDKDKPADEAIWPDNRAQWPVEVIGSSGGGGGGDLPDPPSGGGDIDGGEIGLKIFDSDERELQLQADGVWEREPAKIRAVIDQTKINEGFTRVQNEINSAITQYKGQLESSIDGENISVTAMPAWISNAKTLAVYSPAMLDLKVTGPGTPQQWQVSSSGTGGDYIYTGTIVPTLTTWRNVLNNQKYQAEINGFVITMDYNIQFDVSFDTCEENEDGEEVCEPQSSSKNMTGRYTITVKGGVREFEVFEPNFTLTLHKTPEWQNIHAKDEYKNSKANDWYAGEAILTHINLEARHKHPVSGKYPVILSATTWMREQGGVAAWMKRAKVKERPYWHQVSLNLVKSSEILWAGPKRDIPDPNHTGKYLLRNREKGVDDGVGRQTKSGKITMGDIWYGLQPGEEYGVQGLVSFKFGVDKGFTPFNKGTTLGSQAADYNKQITIIDNALSRILNYTQIK